MRLVTYALSLQTTCANCHVYRPEQKLLMSMSQIKW